MKSSLPAIIVLSASLLTLSACLDPQNKEAPPSTIPPTTADIAVGMSARSFASIFPGAKIPANGQWIRSDESHGLRGEWTYSFYAKRLSWFVFNSFESSVTVNTFRRYLRATQSTVADFTTKYGSPLQATRGVLEFKDPRLGYPGYPVLKASWNTGSEKIRVDYSVLGNTNEKAQLLFTISVRG
jgi:hypothetical protein